MKDLIRWGLRQRKWYIFWWTFGIVAFIALELAFYPSFKDQAAQLDQTFKNMPDSVKALIGDVSGNYFSAQNYLNSRVFYLVIPMLFAVLMISLGSSLLAREEQDGTLELLLARPISRGKIILGKALSGIYITGIVAVAGLVVCILLSKAVGLPNSVAEVTMAMLLSYLMCMVFGAFAFMLTSLGHAVRGLAIGLTTFFFVSSYVLTGLVATIDWLKWPARLLPYYYFEPQKMLNGNYTWSTLLGYTVAIVVFGIIAFVGFRRRDIG